MGASGTTTVDMGAFPGSTHAFATVTGQASIGASSLVEAWILPATTAIHSVDEHIILSSMVDVVAANITAGTGFEIHIVARDLGGSRLEPPTRTRSKQVANATAGQNTGGEPGLVGSVGGSCLNTIWGTVNVAWVWN